ncbi:MAG: Aminodeoxychorismate synthase component 2 [Alphaproteobacteria bacterium MarineAlpha5_Bin12]|nr:MAG: Aminodeoxychorismate synthase component 2 [Alphaproteobacteria bacterium MarineAlpha5_Bin12]|tara:strand:+ start:49654 stop:50223 length:570 start_codon:yes stop_codon:yes gene_type:complete
MIIIIDNYDSFTFNIYHYVSEFYKNIKVYRNDKITIAKILKLKPKAIILSPGPCTPKDAGICIDLVKKVYKKIPILGICLGHQAIGESFGGEIVLAPKIMHGKISKIKHNNHQIFSGINNNFEATRYHSLIIKNNSFNDELNIIASSSNVIMGISHKKYKTFGLQFHPESIGTQIGKKIFKNFINIING